MMTESLRQTCKEVEIKPQTGRKQLNIMPKVTRR